MNGLKKRQQGWQNKEAIESALWHYLSSIGAILFIFHLSFEICHLSLHPRVARGNDKWQISNDKWKMKKDYTPEMMRGA
ncbi:MAG: hypothetical protein ACREB3_00665 [Burkholderiales bacterium]